MDSSPEGPYNPKPGLPGGGGSYTGYGVPAFDINNLPSVASWNKYGEIVALPNPFKKADGTKISSETQWPERRTEIKKILEYYFTGPYPPQPDEVTISGAGATGTGSLTVTVTGNNGRTGSFTVTLTLPSVAPDGQPPSTTNKVPLVLIFGGATNAVVRDNGYAQISFSQNANANYLTNANNIAQKIWDYPSNDPNLPSALVMDAWRAARIIDALEKGAGGGVVDPRQVCVIGSSIGGKGTLNIGAFAESMTGNQIAVTFPLLTCSPGMPVERFVSTVYKNLYYYKNLETAGGTARLLMVPPGGVEGTDYDFARPIRNGIQTWTQAFYAPGEQPYDFTPRFSQFEEIHKDWRTNGIHRPDDNFGLAGTAPFDSHFLAALVAPRGLVVIGATQDNWDNAESAYMSYLATREVYDFLGVNDNIGARFYDTLHATATWDYYNLIDFGNMYFNRTFGTTYTRQEGTGTYPEITDTVAFTDQDPRYYNAADEPFASHAYTWFDPRSRDPAGVMEYTKLNWANPKKPVGSSVAAIVKAYFDESTNAGKVLPESVFLPEE